MVRNSVIAMKIYKTPQDAFWAGAYTQALEGFWEYKNKYNSRAWDAEIAIAQKRIYAQRQPVFCILDEMSQISWGDVLCLEHLTPNNWQIKLRNESWPVFMESTWRGKDASWRCAMVRNCSSMPIAKTLRDLLATARKLEKKIIFWNKEDPLHFNNFLPIAQLADVVLTTDSNSIEQYRAAVPGLKVGCMRFAANSKLCNPAERLYGEAGTVCFAGSNYVRNHNDRLIQLKMLLPVIERFSGVIYDRNLVSGDHSLSFPQRYRSYLRAPLPFADMVSEYKRFKFFLNVNTITDSPTMMARRVYELLACGTPVISWPSRALETQFHGIVQFATSARQASNIMENYLDDEEKWKKLSHLGYREVMRKHTYRHRMRILAKYAGMQWHERPSSIAILALASSSAHIEKLLDSICCQNQDNMEIVIGMRGLPTASREYLAAQIRNRRPDAPLAVLDIPADMTEGKAIAHLAARAASDYCAIMDETCFYFPNYLADMLLPFTYTDAGIAGKVEVWQWLRGIDETHLLNPGCGHRFNSEIIPSTLICQRKLLLEQSGLWQGVDDLPSFIHAARSEGITVYSADSYNFAGVCADYASGMFDRDRKSGLSRFAASGFARELIEI